MNRLERLGWTVAAQDLLGIRRSEALMLRAMVVDAPGHTVSHFVLAGFSGREGDLTSANLRAATRVGFVRRALVDLGFAPSCIQPVASEGYRVPRAVAVAVDRAVRTGSVERVEVAA